MSAEPTSEQTHTVHELTVKLSTHAPLTHRYMNGDFQKVGESGEYGRVDPETDAQYTALGGDDHKYNKDYKIGASYPRNQFVYGKDAEGNSVPHEQVQAAMEAIGLWNDDQFSRVILPKGNNEYGEPTWYYGFKTSPVDHAPQTVSRMVEGVERLVDDSDRVMALGNAVKVYYPEE